MTYRLANYRSPDGERAGAVHAGVLHDVAELTGKAAWSTVPGVLDDWDAAHPAIDAAVGATAAAGRPVADVTLLAPVSRPGAIYCIGANYHDHAEEMRLAAGRPPAPDPRTLGLAPFFFLKSSHAVAGPGATVRFTGYSRSADYELELVAVIGRRARDLTVDDALGCVAGYAIGNDLSARDLRAREGVGADSLMRADWLRHKSFDDAAPMGPWITPAAHIGDPAGLRMRLWVNDELRQDSTSGNMIYSVAEQIAHLSSGITLHPGDLIMTGTPAGVGQGSGAFLRAGDVVRMDIAEIGEMSFDVA